MSAGSGLGAFARRLAIVIFAGSCFATAASAAVPEAEPLLQLAQADTTSGQAEPPPVSSTPDAFTATYGDWQLRCQRNLVDPTATALACEVVIFVVAEGQQQPFAQISLSRGTDNFTHVTAIVPVNVLVRITPTVATDEADTGIAVAWLTCTPIGCIADQALSEEELARFRAYTRQGRLVFTDSVGNVITVSFSFRGLAQALDALASELAK